MACFSMRTNEIALPNIEGVGSIRALLGRIFGYGTVRIEGTGVDAVTTPPSPIQWASCAPSRRRGSMSPSASSSSG